MRDLEESSLLLNAPIDSNSKTSRFTRQSGIKGTDGCLTFPADTVGNSNAYRTAYIVEPRFTMICHIVGASVSYPRQHRAISASVIKQMTGHL